MSTDVKETSSVGSTSLDDSLVEDEDFQLVNAKGEKQLGSRRSSSASLASSARVSGSQNNLITLDSGEPEEERSAADGLDEQEDGTEPSAENDAGVMEILYGKEAQQDAIRNLIIFSIVMFTLPMVVIYASYTYFVETLHWPRDEAALYAGILGIASVLAVVVVFLWVAYREVQNDQKRVAVYKQSKKED